MIVDLFEDAFMKGCGVKLEEAKASQRYQQLLYQQESLFEKYPENSDQGIALRSGHYTMGLLFNTFSEQEALRQAQCQGIVVGSIEYRALIQLLGEYIVAEAAKCLPSEVIDMAENWKQADSEKQVEIGRELYFLFGSEGQRKEDELNRESLWKIVSAQKQHNAYMEEAFLPRLYGKWDQKSCPANCLGKTQMLTAFARLVGAAVVEASPIVSAKDALNRWRTEAREKIEEDILSRDIHPDKKLWESMIANRDLDFFRMVEFGNFHDGTALQLKDGRWLLIDPHGLDWGIFPDVWGLNGIWQMLRKYQEVLPGLSMVGHDHGISDGTREQELENVESLLERSRKLEAKLGDADNPDIYRLIKILAVSDDLELILSDLAGMDKETARFFKDNPNIREALATMLVLGEEFPSLGSIFQLTTDHELAKEKIGSLLTAYHCIAANNLRDGALNEAGSLLHPVCEFALPEYSIALGVLNSLDCNEEKVDPQFFVEYGFNQLVLANAMTEIFPKQSRSPNVKLARAAAKTLSTLPFRHPLVEKFLKFYPQILKRKEEKENAR